MSQINRRTALAISLAACGWVWMQPAWADEYDDTIAMFKKADETGKFWGDAYGYAVFPKILKGAVGIGGARGTGRVYREGQARRRFDHDPAIDRLPAGRRGIRRDDLLREQGCVRHVHCRHFRVRCRSIRHCHHGRREREGRLQGAGAGASVTKDKASAVAAYRKGVAVFTIIRGGLMYEVSLAGQKYSYKKI